MENANNKNKDMTPLPDSQLRAADKRLNVLNEINRFRECNNVSETKILLFFNWFLPVLGYPKHDYNITYL